MNEAPSKMRISAAITGMGAVTPFGNNLKSFWQAVVSGKNAFTTIRQFSTEDHRTHVAAEIRELPPFEPRRLNKELLSRADILALSAALEALKHAGLLKAPKRTVAFSNETAIVVGTAAGGILGLENFFRQRAFNRHVESPLSMLSSFTLSAIATNIAREFRIEGPRMTLATVCSSSGLALAAAKELLETENLEHILVVGTETLSEVILAGFNSLRSVASKLCQPFDLNRRGLVLGEGAGAIVLQKSSPNDKANSFSNICLAGYGLTTDLHHFTAPRPDGQAISETIFEAIKDASVNTTEIDYVNAHGTATELNDVAETRGLKTALGTHARDIPISSTKSMIGHQLGAASILEGITTVLSMQNGVVTPTANLEVPDPECDLDYTGGGAREYEINCALSNSFAFGGSNISLIFSKNHKKQDSKSYVHTNAFDMPVITGIGLATPIGIGRSDFTNAIDQRKSGLVSLKGIGNEWRNLLGGAIDMSVVREKIPVKERRRFNSLSAFLFVALEEALVDAGIDSHLKEDMAFTYGSAFGCSSNVHAVFSQILTDGPKFTSPHDFNMSVTNAPPSTVAQALDLKGPIWVFSGDEASFDISLHWAAMLIQKGKWERVIVSAADEISDSIIAIHQSLGLLKTERSKGISLGEGAVCVIVESKAAANRRGAHIYGTLCAWDTTQDVTCGPQDYSSQGNLLLTASTNCLKKMESKIEDFLCISPENGNSSISTITPQVINQLKETYNLASISYRDFFGESGISGGLSLCAALLNSHAPTRHALLLTSARGGINAASLFELGKEIKT